LLKKALCDQVKLTPEDNNNKVLRKGTSQNLIISNPTGGHTDPIQIEGANEE